ncbi:helix-turn-helix domain-containing protein [Kitasatospora sp. NPDC090091]|uniref:helix-turn-helix domain-containing protein n=1 Tax=Kitasatospora sp. NPDC090091 TaxID=3364081 RepID=UPI0037F7EF0F
MPEESFEHAGKRIAYYRKLRRLTQEELAAAALTSYSLLTKVEQGKVPASPTLLGALSHALRVPVTDLTGQPYRTELEADEIDPLIQGIRDALDGYDLGADEEVRPRPLSELHQAAEALCARVRNTDIKGVAIELPALIDEVTSAAYLAPSDSMWRVLASLYRTAYDVTSKLGYPDLSMIALDRLQWASERASDPVLAATRQYYRTLAYTRSGRIRTGSRLIAASIALLGEAAPGRERDVVAGQLHLGAAVVAARSGDGDRALDHIAEATRIAALTGPAEQVHWLSFGLPNCGVHKVSILADLERYPEAVEAAGQLEIPTHWPVSRYAAHVTEVARAQVMIGDSASALASLRRARRMAPQQVRYHPVARSVVGALMHGRRNPPRELTSLASWVGM